ncbi:hypothetical protein V2J09_001321 [Rumex salicifolius]
MTGQISFLLFIILSTFVTCSAIDTLKASESLGFNQTLISSGQKYEAGFFSPQGSDEIYLGIWYYNLSDPKTVVWVANRDNPARNSSVVLEIKNDRSGKIVVTEQGVELWASNKSASNVVSPFVQLLDTGNLVVREANSVEDDNVWQSFDYPTDTLLPYQKLGWTRKTGLDRRLISWKSTSDPASGNYSLVLIRTGDPDLLVKSDTKTIYRTGPYTGQGLSGVPAMKPSTGLNFTLPKTPDEVYYMFGLVNPSIRSRLTMSSDGTLYRYTWVPNDQYWNQFWYHPDVPCDKYMACGPYGVCDDKTLFGCMCPHGFVPRDSSAMSLQDESQGCMRRTGMECGTDGFRVMRNMKLPVSGAATVDGGMGLEECRKACKMDCNCTAYANARVVGGVGSGCVMWTGDLLDMRTFQQGGQNLYIRLAAADLSMFSFTIKLVFLFNLIYINDYYGDIQPQKLVLFSIMTGVGNNKTNRVKVGVGVSVVLATIIVAIAAAFAWKSKYKLSATSRPETRHDLQLIGKTTSKRDLSLYNNDKNELELPFYNFDAIVAITNNFSEENKLGQGGFGSVFKGVFNEVQELAIKRLSKESIQGFEEFKNEVNLIAKLQHRNLVKLLGYCIDKEEKMLIYEYLRNRSLDFLLMWEEGKSSEIVDPSIGDSYRLYEVLKCVQLGLLCVQSEPFERPTMSSVLLMLTNETATLPQPKPPGFYLGWRHEESETDVNEFVTINQVTITAVDVTILSSFTSVFSVDTLNVSESLGINQTLISSRQKYEAGFFTPPGSEPDKIYLGIWYYNLSDPKTVVWVANRDNPARNSSVALVLKSDGGGQIVMTWNGVEVWASNKSASNVVSPFVQLLDSGNLIVREANSNDDYIWQSFDYPTDTLLPNQKLGWTQKTGLDRRLISWKSAIDPGISNYSFTLTRTGDPEFFVRSGTTPTYRTGPFTGQGLSGVPAMKPSTGINYTLLDSPNEVYYMFILLDPTIKSRLVMGLDGVLSRYTWVPESQGWNTFWYFPQDPCDNYLSCGPNGVCDNSQLFDCGCPHGFVYRDSTAVSLRDGSHGCARRTTLECGTDGFWVLRNMKLPMSGAATVDRGMGLEACREACKKDCNCTAYANAQVVGGVRSGCVMWTGDLLDMRNFQDGGQDLYIRLAAVDLSNDKAKKVKIAIGVSVVLAILIVGIAASYVWKANHKPSGTMDQSDWRPIMNGTDLHQSQQEESDTINQVTVTMIDGR